MTSSHTRCRSKRLSMLLLGRQQEQQEQQEQLRHRAQAKPGLSFLEELKLKSGRSEEEENEENADPNKSAPTSHHHTRRAPPPVVSGGGRGSFLAELQAAVRFVA